MAEAFWPVSAAGRAYETDAAARQLLNLLTLLSPAFPVGSFSYSQGLEWLIDSGSIRTAASLNVWLIDVLEVGSGWNDAVLLTEAHRAGTAQDDRRLRDVAELADALAPSAERHLETVAQGSAFLSATSVAWPCRSANILADTGAAAYPVAVGAVAAGHGIPLEQVLLAYLNIAGSNLVSVGVRLVPLGQSAGLAILAGLHPLIQATARRALASSLDGLGAATIRADIASMRHEEQHSRIFRT
jgi:urease accessory protein